MMDSEIMMDGELIEDVWLVWDENNGKGLRKLTDDSLFTAYVKGELGGDTDVLHVIHTNNERISFLETKMYKKARAYKEKLLTVELEKQFDAINVYQEIKIENIPMQDDSFYLDKIWNLQIELLQYCRDNIIGNELIVKTPFGERTNVYCDWITTGKQLKCIENYIIDNVSSVYGDVNNGASMTGVQTAKFDNDARDIIMESCGCDRDKDVAIFCGNGVTAAINKLLGIFQRREDYNPASSICIIGPYERNSNILIWKEAGMKLIEISEAENGGLDQKELKAVLTRYHDEYNLKICSFCAVSNVSGIIEDIDNISDICHKYGFYCCWDYASAAPYLDINFNNKDAVFISTHKFMGGSNTPGILLAKKHLFKNDVPVIPGDNTVSILTKIEEDEYYYDFIKNIGKNEEAGIADVIGRVRAGLSFKIKDEIGVKSINKINNHFSDNFISFVQSLNNIVIAGNTDAKRLPIFCLNMFYKKKWLHPNYITALLNDLFGIQANSGFFNTDKYIISSWKDLLNLKSNKKLQEMIDYTINEIKNNNNALAKFGYFRIHFHYTLSFDQYSYILKAIEWISQNAQRLLPLYTCDPSTGVFKFREKKTSIEYQSLHDVSFIDNKITYPIKQNKTANISDEKYFTKLLEEANEIVKNIKYYLPSRKELENDVKIDKNEFRCYWMPYEARL